MLSPDVTVVELCVSYRNAFGTGVDLIISNPLDGNVDILMYQVICDIVPDEPQISLTLPLAEAQEYLATIKAVMDCPCLKRAAVN